jgi:hypothetical protein
VLARTFEQSGIATVIVTMMPDWCERIGAPRTLGVEHPFGQAMGPAGDDERQRAVFNQALSVLSGARRPGEIEESDYTWPDPDTARKAWHPPEPSPIVRELRKASNP